MDKEQHKSGALKHLLGYGNMGCQTFKGGIQNFRKTVICTLVHKILIRQVVMKILGLRSGQCTVTIFV